MNSLVSRKRHIGMHTCGQTVVFLEMITPLGGWDVPPFHLCAMGGEHANGFRFSENCRNLPEGGQLPRKGS